MCSDLPPSDCFIFVVWSHNHVLQDHIEGYHELSAKTKAFFSAAVAKWDAEFYVKIDDDVHVNLGTSLFFSCHIYPIVPEDWKLMIFSYLEINSWAAPWYCRYTSCNSCQAQVETQGVYRMHEIWTSSLSKVTSVKLFLPADVTKIFWSSKFQDVLVT